MIRILIADDHAVVRFGTHSILAKAYPDAEFGEAGNAVELLQTLRQQHWDLVVLDIKHRRAAAVSKC